jgi:hypothetical protein
MIKDKELLEEFNNRETRNKLYSYEQSLKIFEALWQEAVALGALPSKNKLEGIDRVLRIARAVNPKNV